MRDGQVGSLACEVTNGKDDGRFTALRAIRPVTTLRGEDDRLKKQRLSVDCSPQPAGLTQDPFHSETVSQVLQTASRLRRYPAPG